MKRAKTFLAVLAATLMILVCYTGCNNGTPAKASYDYATTEAYGGDAWDEEADYPAATDSAKGMTTNSGAPMQNEGMSEADLEQQARDMAEKIIYQGSATIETTDFDKTLADLDAMIASYHGFVERTDISGQSYESSYYKRASLRRAEYTIRVPKTAFMDMKTGLESLGYVTNTNYWTENVTARYMDIESRLATYRAEETSLLAMMEKAEAVEDMILIESRLSEVRYEIESLTSSLRYYQNQVDYSTLTLSIREVTKIVEETEVPVTYWDEIKESFRNGWDFTVDALGGFGKAIVTLIPILVIPAIIVVVVIVLVRRRNSRRRAAYARPYGNYPQQPQPPQQPPQDPGVQL